MLYIGWDIGIKNMAYCIIDHNHIENQSKILELDIINLIETEPEEKCSQKNKNGKDCRSIAEYVSKKDDKIYYCNKHYKQYINEGNPKTQLKKVKKKKIKANLVPLETLGKKLFLKLDENKIFMECDNIIIENQPVLKNPKMKSLQIMLYSYFLIKNKKINDIQLINASNKLKVYKGKLDTEIETHLKGIKDKYKKNKETAVEHSRKMIRDAGEKVFLEKFNSHKKNDDLADAYLMCHYFINKHNK
jgi:hypothetical protein